MHAVVLRYLDHVARLGSIRRAAEALNVASSAVNRQILKLEAEIVAALFERRGNGVRLTPAGLMLARRARAMGTLCIANPVLEARSECRERAKARRGCQARRTGCPRRRGSNSGNATAITWKNYSAAP